MSSCCSEHGIDIHAHIVPENFPDWLEKPLPSGWPSMVAAEAKNGRCHRNVMIDGKLYRSVSDQCWSVPERISDLPDMGIGLQVISPMPELLGYWLPTTVAQPLVRFLNESMAEMVAESGGALKAFGALPMQDMDLAIKELDYVIDVLGFSGVEIGSNINGVPLGDSQLRPFFEACSSKNVPIFVHALKPTGMDRLTGPGKLQQVLAYPSDVGLAAASVVTGNLLVDLPNLHIAFSHGGGSFASLLPRLQQGWHTFPDLHDYVKLSPNEQARKLYFDTLVFDSFTLQHLVAKFGDSQLIIGTDYPFNFHERKPVLAIQDCGFSDELVQALVSGNALRFLNQK